MFSEQETGDVEKHSMSEKSQKTRGFTARSSPNGVAIDQVERFQISDFILLIYIYFVGKLKFIFWNQVNFLLTELENRKSTQFRILELQEPGLGKLGCLLMISFFLLCRPWENYQLSEIEIHFR